MNKYKIQFQKPDYSFDFIEIEASNKLEAVKKVQHIINRKSKSWLNLRYLMWNCEEMK